MDNGHYVLKSFWNKSVGDPPLEALRWLRNVFALDVDGRWMQFGFPAKVFMKGQMEIAFRDALPRWFRKCVCSDKSTYIWWQQLCKWQLQFCKSADYKKEKCKLQNYLKLLSSLYTKLKKILFQYKFLMILLAQKHASFKFYGLKIVLIYNPK